MTAFSSRAISVVSNAGYPLGKGKHFNLAWCPLDGKVYQHGGDLTESSCQEMFTYDWSTNTWAQIQNKCGSANQSWDGTLTDMAQGLRPSQPDDGAWFWDSTENRFWWVFGGGQLAYGGTILSGNQCGDGLPVDAGGGLNASYIQTATRWRGYRVMQFDPQVKRWYEVAFTENTQGFQSIGAIYGADNVSRGNAYDPVARKIFRIYQNGSQAIAVFDLASRTVSPFTMAGLANNENFNGPENLTLSYAHNAMCVDSSNGYLYAVLPHTGQLLQIRTRDTPIYHDNYGYGPLYRLPMYLLDNPISPIPAWRSTTIANGYKYVGSDHCVLRVWGGGLLYIMQDAGAIDGRPYQAFWRSLTNVASSKWVPFQMPSNFVASSWTTNTDSAGNFYALGAHIDPPQFKDVPLRIWKISP